MSALTGMRVLDMTQYEAGTSCTQLLAWLGADVVKVESPTGDPGRGVTVLPQTSQYFLNYNGNKRSIVIDLKSEGGKELFLKMVPHYDVFVENYGPGVIESLSIGYDELKALNPGLIYARLKGFGLSGPYSQFNCYDWVAQAAAGAFSVTGTSDGPPLPPGTTAGDSGTGVQLALAITAAYVQKQRTGKGQQIEISMQEAVTLYMRTQGLRSWGTAPGVRTGTRRGSASTDVYPCLGGGPNDYIFVMCVTSNQWDALCTAIGRLDLTADPRFEDAMARVTNSEELFEEIRLWTVQHPKYEAMDILASHGVPCSAVLDTQELFTDPHLASRGFIKTIEHPTGQYQVMDCPMHLSDSPVEHRAAPELGANTSDVLMADLGLDEAAIAEYMSAGAIRGR